MSTVNTPEANIQDTPENLIEFVRILEESHSQIVAANSELEADIENLPELVALLENSIADLGENLGHLQQQWTDADTSLNSAQESVAEFTTAAEGKLDTSLQSLEAAENSFQSECNADRQTLEQNVSEVQNGFVELGESSSVWEESLVELQETTSNTFNEVEQSIAQFQETVDTLQSETESDFEGLIEDIVEQHNPGLTDLMSSCIENLSEDYLNQVATDFDNFETEAINLYQTFDSDITNLGISFQSQEIELINSSIEYCKDSLGDEVSSAFDEAINQVVENLMDEILTTVVTTKVGATVTTTMAPILPQLVIAKKAVQAINAAKDFFNPFS